MRSIGHFLLHVCALVCLTACATPYVPPPVEGNAQLTFRQSGLLMMRMFQNGKDCSGPVGLGKKGPEILEGREALVLPAGREVAFWLQTSNSSLSNFRFCTLTVSFVPSANQNYRLLFSADSQECVARVVRVDSASGGEREAPEPSARKRVQQTPFLESGSFCKPE